MRKTLVIILLSLFISNAKGKNLNTIGRGSNSERYGKIEILMGEQINVGIDYMAAIPCSSDFWPIVKNYWEWSEIGEWGGVEWAGVGAYYDYVLFDPKGYGTPSPFSVGTLTVYDAGGNSDKIIITAIPTAPNYRDGDTPSPDGSPGGAAPPGLPDKPPFSEGDPVNPVIGNNFYLSRDLYSSERGMDIDFYRFFANQENENYDDDYDISCMRPFGWGWTHSYNIYLTIEGGAPDTDDWTCRVHYGDGNEVYYEWNSSEEEYSSSKGDHNKLELIIDSGDTLWVLKRMDGKKYYFTKKNRKSWTQCDSIVGINGNKIDFNYNGNKLTEIKGPSGRQVNITYSGNLIQRIYDHSGPNSSYYAYRYQTNNGYPELTRVVRYNSTASDSIVLERYFYDNNHNLRVRVLPTGKYSENNTADWSYKKGDRVYYWYDGTERKRLEYIEFINGDGDENLSNDEVIYKVYFKYYPGGSTGSPDSTVVYYYQDSIEIGAMDTSNTPQQPNPLTDNVFRKKIVFDNDGNFTKSITIPRYLPPSTYTYESYDSDYNLKRIITPENDTFSYTYEESYTDPSGTRYFPNVTKIEYPIRDSIRIWYGLPTGDNPRYIATDSIRDELWRKIEYYYDGSGNIDSMVYPSRYISGTGITDVSNDFTHNSKGNLTEIRDPVGNISRFSYAPNDTGPYLTQRRIDIAPSGNGDEDIVTEFSYNKIGQTEKVTYYRDYPKDYSIINREYDLLNRLEKIQYPDGTELIYTYDKRGNIIKKEIRNKESEYYSTIEYRYDAMNNLIKTKEYVDEKSPSDSTLYRYNLHSELIGFTNANDSTGVSTEIKYRYDAGRLYSVEYPDTTNDSLGYYPDGNIKFKRNRREKVISYNYDKMDRLIKKLFYDSFLDYQSENPADSVIFGYDKTGKIVSMIDNNGTINYSYDEMNHLDTMDVYQRFTTTYEYDKVGNRTKLKVFNHSNPGEVYLCQEYTEYDEANRLKRTMVGNATFDFTYWDVGSIKKIEYPNNFEENYILTSRNFIDSVDITFGGYSKYIFSYDYNAVGDRVGLNARLGMPMGPPVSGIGEFEYDDLRRLTQAYFEETYYKLKNIYTYDKTGNRVKKKVEVIPPPGYTRNYTYNKSNNQLMSVDADNYYYDRNGNLTEYITSYEYYFDWDYENRLTEIRLSDTKNEDTLTLTYCGQGKRIRKVNHSTNDTTEYVYDGMFAVGEFGGHKNLKYNYVYANGLLLARYNTADTHYYHHDGLGSIIGITDRSGSIEQTYFYDGFGNILADEGDVDNHYLFAGYEYDKFAGLYNLRARYYAPELGRFISEDPISQREMSASMPHYQWFFPISSIHYTPQSINPYIYCSNNPVNFVDPYGMFAAHGNWCGPSYSGGKDKSVDDMNPNELKSLKPPEDCKDICCMHHDFCVLKCRRFYDYGIDRMKCWLKCWNELQDCTNNCGNDIPNGPLLPVE